VKLVAPKCHCIIYYFLSMHFVIISCNCQIIMDVKSEVTCHKTWRRFQTRVQTEQLEHHIKFSTGYPIFRFPHKNDVRLIRIYLQLFTGGLMSFYLICVCLHIVVSNTYCVVFLFCFSWSCVPYVASFSRLSIFYHSFVFSTFIYGKNQYSSVFFHFYFQCSFVLWLYLL